MPSERGTRELHISRFAIVLGVAILALLGGGITLAMTRNGMRGGPDAVAYLSATDNLAHGRGLTMAYVTLTERYSPEQAAAFAGRIPIVLAPPGYPLATGSFGALGLGLIAATRAVNAAVVVFGLGVAGWMLSVLSNRRWPAVFGGLAVIVVAPAESVFGVTQSWLGLASGPASEVPFIACALGALAMIAGYLGRETRAWATLAVGSVAAAIMTRYIGTSLTLALSFSVLLLGSGNFGRRALRAAGLGALTVAPAFLWTTANSLFLDANSPRSIAFHPPGIADYWGAAVSAADWFLPGSGGGWRLVAFAGISVAAVTIIIAGFRALPRAREGTPDAAGLLYRVLVIFIPCYLTLLVVTRTFFDAGVPLRAKSLTPLQPVVYILLIGVLPRLAESLTSERARTIARIVPVGLVVVVLAAVGWHTAYDDARTAPFASLLPVNAPGAALLRSLPADRLIVSNSPDGVFNLARRSAIAVPLELEATTGERNAAYAENVRQLDRLLRESGGTLVLFRGSPLGTELPARLGLDRTRHSPTVDLYRHPGANRPG